MRQIASSFTFFLQLFLLVNGQGSYTPEYVSCPVNQTYIRPASSGLSPREATWLNTRRPNVVTALASYLSNVGISGFNSSSYESAISQNASLVPVVGMALSGGGIRAEYNAFGFYQAFDSRYPKANAAHTGGLLQATTYLGGLSGGCITTGILAINDFADVQTLAAGGRLSGADVPEAVYESIAGKAEVGFNLSVSDIIGISESYYASGQNLGLRFSNITNSPSFLNGTAPLPLFMLLEVIPLGVPGSNDFEGILYPVLNATNNTLYELTPFEFGSWKGRASAFVPTSLLGTTFTGGRPANTSECVEGYDTVGWTLGAAVTAVNAWVVDTQTNGTEGQFSKRQLSLSDQNTLEDLRQVELLSPFVDEVLPGILAALGNASVTDVGYGFVPNPFFGYNGSDVHLQTQSSVMLVDAGESGQESPIWPLIQPSRKLDYLLVSDNCGSELPSGWMNGTNIFNTAAYAQANNVPFPKIPDSDTMLILNYTVKPVFFGCNDPDVPLVLYVADAPYSAYTNITGGVTAEDPTTAQLQLIWQNQLDVVSQSNTTWAECIACGAILRSLERMGQDLPPTCSQCFDQHCWNGEAATGPVPYVDPPLFLQPNISYAAWNATVWIAAGSSSASTTSTGSASSSTRTATGSAGASSPSSTSAKGAGSLTLGTFGWAHVVFTLAVAGWMAII